MKKFILATFILLFSADICFAAVVSFPTIEQIYTILIGTSAGLALLAIIYGGVHFVLSVGDPHLMGEAKTWVIAGFTGLILIVAAGTIYKGITGGFPSFSATEPPEIPEVPEETFPGVYVFTKSNCEPEDRLGRFTNSQSNTSSLDIDSIKVIDVSPTNYVFIIFNRTGFQGTEIGEYYAPGGCINISQKISSIAVFDIGETSPIKAGEKVEFYTDTHYDSSKGGVVVVKNNKISVAPPGAAFENLDNLDADWAEIKHWGPDAPSEKQSECKHLYEPPGWFTASPSCLESIKIIGSYAVLLFGEYFGEYRYELFFGPENPPFSGGPRLLTVDHLVGGGCRPQKVRIFPFATK